MSETAATAAPYHHGDLPRALRTAAAELVAEVGPAGFSLREVARRAGVSHAAPAHHFGDRAGLLTAVAIEALDHLQAVTSSAVAENEAPKDRLMAVGRAYVTVATDHPGHCQVAFRRDLVNADDPDYVDAGDRAMAVLVDAVTDVAEQCNPGLDTGLAAQLCWAAMQGLVELYPKMSAQHDEPQPIEEMAEAFAELLFSGLAPGA